MLQLYDATGQTLLRDSSAFGTGLTPDRSEVLIASAAAPSNGRLGTSASLSLKVDGHLAGPVTLASSATADNATLDDLVLDLNDSLAAAGLGATVVAGQIQGRLTLSLVGADRGKSFELQVLASDPASTLLHFVNGQQTGTQGSAFPLGDLAGVARVAGLTLHDTADVDWFSFTLAAAGTASDRIVLATVQGTAPAFQLFDRDGKLLQTASAGRVSMAGQSAGEYFLKVSANLGTVTYQLLPSIAGGGATVIDLSGPGQSSLSLGDIPGLPTVKAHTPYLLRVGSNQSPTIYDLAVLLDAAAAVDTVNMATRSDAVRRSQ